MQRKDWQQQMSAEDALSTVVVPLTVASLLLLLLH